LIAYISKDSYTIRYDATHNISCALQAGV